MCNMASFDSAAGVAPLQGVHGLGEIWSVFPSFTDSQTRPLILESVESNRATNLHNDTYTPPPPKHDILDVSAYLERGLVASTVDRWFLGPVPKFPLTPGLGVPMKDLPVREVPALTTVDKGKGKAKQVEVEMDDVLIDHGPQEADGKKKRLDDALRKARRKLEEGRNGLAWPPVRIVSSYVRELLTVWYRGQDTLPPDLSSLDRNLDALAGELAQRCSVIFQTASSAVTRAAQLSNVPDTVEDVEAATRPKWTRERTRFHWQVAFARCCARSNSTLIWLRRSRICCSSCGRHTFRPPKTIRLATVRPPAAAPRSSLMYLLFSVCLFRTAYGPSSTGKIISAVITCEVPGDNGTTTSIDLLDAEFFDRKHLVVVFRPRSAGGDEDEGAETTLATVQFAAVEFHIVEEAETKDIKTREALIAKVLRRVQTGVVRVLAYLLDRADKLLQMPATPLELLQSRTLAGCTKGAVVLAVNGRQGRRVTCVLGEDGTALEVFDMDAEEDEDEEVEVEVEAETDEARSAGGED